MRRRFWIYPVLSDPRRSRPCAPWFALVYCCPGFLAPRRQCVKACSHAKPLRRTHGTCQPAISRPDGSLEARKTLERATGIEPVSSAWKTDVHRVIYFINSNTKKYAIDDFVGKLSEKNFWSGRRESNPYHQLGRLRSYHYTTPAQHCRPIFHADRRVKCRVMNGPNLPLAACHDDAAQHPRSGR